MNEIPRWFRDTVANGLQRFIALSLAGTPPAETIKLTAATWCDLLWNCGKAWDPDLDARRIEAGFVTLANQIDRWPAPRQLLQHLPSRPEQRALAEPDRTPEQVERARHYIQLTKELLRAPGKSDETQP